MTHPADYYLPPGEFDITEHEHSYPGSCRTLKHTHAYGTMDHGHMLRAVCTAEECKGLKDTHNIHPAPKRTTEQERENPEFVEYG